MANICRGSGDDQAVTLLLQVRDLDHCGRDDLDKVMESYRHRKSNVAGGQITDPELHPEAGVVTHAFDAVAILLMLCLANVTISVPWTTTTIENSGAMPKALLDQGS